MTGDKLTIVIEVRDTGRRWHVSGHMHVEAFGDVIDADALRVAGDWFFLQAMETLGVESSSEN